MDAGAAAARQVREVEPNDAVDQAATVELDGDTTLHGEISEGATDVDIYALHSSSARLCDISAHPRTALDVAVDLVDGTAHTLVSVNSSGVGTNEDLANVAVAGRTLLRVRAAAGSGGYDVHLRCRNTASDAEREPNNRAADATELHVGDALAGVINGAADEDWYRWQIEPAPASDGGDLVPSPDGTHDGGDENFDGSARVVESPIEPNVPQRSIRIDLTSPSSAPLRVRVRTEANAILFESTSPGTGRPLALRNIAVRPIDGVLYFSVDTPRRLSVADAGSAADTTLPYSIVVTWETSTGESELEPNDEPTKATTHTLGSTTTGFLSPAQDVDYFQVTATPTDIFDVTLSGVDGVDLAISLVSERDGREVTLLRSNDGAAKEPEYLRHVRCTDSCFVKVEGTSRKVGNTWVRDGESANVAYHLTTAVMASGNYEAEPNDSVAVATPILLNQPLLGTIYPKRDVDLYAFDPTPLGVKTHLEASVSGILKVDVALVVSRISRAADGNADSSKPAELIQTADRAKADANERAKFVADPAGGIYLLEVRDTKMRESNFQDHYVISIRAIDGE